MLQAEWPERHRPVVLRDAEVGRRSAGVAVVVAANEHNFQVGVLLSPSAQRVERGGAHPRAGMVEVAQND
jgi:hypothetical protein